MFYSLRLKKFKELKHCFFSKKNGFSKGIYRSLNCGKGSSDNKKNIRKFCSFNPDEFGPTGGMAPVLLFYLIKGGL